MHDPFIPPIPFLSRAVQPLSDYLGFTTLPLHIHEVLISFFFYTWVNLWGSPAISRFLFPLRYDRLEKDKKLNWDVHVVSLVQSTLICTLAFYVMIYDEERKNMTWDERIWGYTGGAGMIQGFATGYFIWDLIVTLQNLKNFGLGMLAHAVSALVVFSFGFRPFVNYYGCTFILYELSSPFLNFHWFFDKLGMTGSKAQLYNGGMLLLVFFSCRLVWGTYQSIRVYQDVWAALHHVPAAASVHFDTLNLNSTVDAALGKSADPIHRDGVMQFAGEEYCPLWLAFAYMGSNIVLNGLNFYWFGKMIETIKKRFQPSEKEKTYAEAAKSTGADGRTKITVDDTTTRKRRTVQRTVTDDLPPPTV